MGAPIPRDINAVYNVTLCKNHPYVGNLDNINDIVNHNCCHVDSISLESLVWDIFAFTFCILTADSHRAPPFFHSHFLSSNQMPPEKLNILKIGHLPQIEQRHLADFLMSSQCQVSLSRPTLKVRKTLNAYFYFMSRGCSTCAQGRIYPN